MALDPSIALGVRPLQLPDPLAQMAQVSQIQAAQRQGEVAQQQQQLNKMKIEELIADRQELNDFALKLKDTGITPRKYMEMLRSSRDPVKQEKGMEGLMRLDEIEKFDAYLARQAKPAGATMPTGAPSMMRQPVAAPAAPTQDMLGTGMYGMAPTAPMNALAASAGVSPQPSVNALASPQSRLDELEARFREVSRFSAPGAKAEADRLKDQIKQLQAVHVVPNVGLVSGAGQTIVASGMAPTEIKKLTSERDSLPAGDPRRKVYDQAIADLGAANRNAEARLRFDQSKFAFEKANPTMSIQQTPTGYVAINTQNGMAIPVLYGQAGFQATGGAQPAVAPAASMMRQPPAALPGQRTPAIPGMASVLDQTAVPAVAPTVSPMALPVGAPGTPVMGKQSELKPIPSNINLAILKNNQSIQQIDETIKLLKKNPEATGVKGYLPGFALNRMDPSGVEARAGVADIGSLVLHDRSGAAVTAAEAPRLVPFIPLPTDDNATVIKKLTRMRNIAAQEQTGLTETYGKDQGYAPNPTVGKTSGLPLSAEQIPPIYATNGKERIVSTDGGQTWTPANK